MCRGILLLAAIVVAGGCTESVDTQPQPAAGVALAADVEVRPLARGVWLHTTTKTYPGGERVPSNGLLLEQDGGSLLIDTAWSDEQTEHLLRWAAETLGRPVRRAVVTHAHDDRMGGLAALRRAGVPVHAAALTAARAREEGLPAPDSTWSLGAREAVSRFGVEVFYPGPGHAPDNVVVWVPGTRVLFGGCLVKAGNATGLGFTGDADLAGWPLAISHVLLRYRSARMVVPGHGPVGGTPILEHTVSLLAEHPRSSGG